MTTPQEILARARREKLSIAEAVQQLLKDTDLKTTEDAEEWLRHKVEIDSSLMTGQERVNYDLLREKTYGQSASRQLWYQRNSMHSLPSVIRHIMEAANMAKEDAIELFSAVLRPRWYYRPRNDGTIGQIWSNSLNDDKWDDETICISIDWYEMLVRNTGINPPTGWLWFERPVPSPPHVPLSPAPMEPSAPASPVCEPTIMKVKKGASYPGRPSVMNAVEQEMRRRDEAKEMMSILAREANALSAWAKEKFPGQQTPTPKAIQNALRDLHRTLK
ncbi:MAG: hypothetical protein H7839_13360 [Magnetococcus sp. YQC-5]